MAGSGNAAPEVGVRRRGREIGGPWNTKGNGGNRGTRGARGDVVKA